MKRNLEIKCTNFLSACGRVLNCHPFQQIYRKVSTTKYQLSEVKVNLQIVDTSDGMIMKMAR